MSLLQSLLAVLRARARSTDGARGSRRFTLNSQARMRAADTVGAKWQNVMLEDLSIGGARLTGAFELARKSTVDLMLSLGTAGEIPIRAVVVHVRDKRAGSRREYGLRFVDLSYDRYRVLIDYINEREGPQQLNRRSGKSDKRA